MSISQEGKHRSAERKMTQLPVRAAATVTGFDWQSINADSFAATSGLYAQANLGITAAASKSPR